MSESRTFHFELLGGGRLAGAANEKLTLKVGGREVELQTHSRKTLERAAGRSGALALALGASPAGLSHFAEVPADCLKPHQVTFITVEGPKNETHSSALGNLYHLSFHIPENHLRRYARRRAARLTADNRFKAFLPTNLWALGVRPDHLAALEANSSDLFLEANDLKSPWETALGLLFMHPQLGNSRAYEAAQIMHEHIGPSPLTDPDQYNRVYELATAISRQGPATSAGGFATYGQMLDPDGRPMFYEFDWLDKNRQVTFREGDPVMQYNLSDETEKYCGSPAASALKTSRNDPGLQNRAWSVNQSGLVEKKEFSGSEKKAAPKTAAAKQWTCTNKMPNHGLKTYPDSIKFDLKDNKLSVDFLNTYLRQLGVFVEFFEDQAMTKPIKNPKVNGSWPFYFPEALAKQFETESKKALGVLTNVNTIMGIPMPTDPTKYESAWPTEAQAARFHFGGLGTTNWQLPIDWPGVILTGVFQYAVPVIFMVGGAMVTDAQWYKAFISDKGNVACLAGIAFPFVAMDITVESVLGNMKAVMIRFANTAIGFLAKKGLEWLALFVGEKLLEAELLTAIPYVGTVYRIAATTMDLAQMAVTTGELLSSPATLEVDLKRCLTLNVTVKPDPAHGEKGRPETAIWPPVASGCQVTVEYRNGGTYTQTKFLPEINSSEPLVFTFPDLGWGGQLKFKAAAYSDTGWLAGLYESGYLEAKPDQQGGDGSMNVSGAITETLVPLSPATQYQYKQRLNYDPAQKRYIWEKGAVPVSANSAINCSNVGPNICKLQSMTILNEDFQVGYCYQGSNQNRPLEDPDQPVNTGQMYVLQNISLLDAKALNHRHKASEVGFKTQPLIAYDTFGQGPDKATISPANFILDTRFGRCHLRQVDLRDESPGFGLVQADKSWGTFSLPHLDAMVVHPSGYVLAVSWLYSKIQILKLGLGPVPDNEAPTADMVSGEGILQGLLNGPIALSIAPDGRLLILETKNARVQAFDLKGNPVPSFTGARLFSSPAEEVAAELDQSVWPDRLKRDFSEEGLNFIFSEPAAGLAKELDQGRLTQPIIDIFTENGFYLSYAVEGQAAPEIKSDCTVKVIRPGQSWEIDDPGKPALFSLKSDGREIQVFEEMRQMTVEVVAAGRKWLLRDAAGARTWLALADQDNPSEVAVHDYLSYLPLHQPDGVTFLDLAMETQGHIYVLSHTGSGARDTDYRLDIYAPDGAFLSRSPDPELVRDPGLRQHLAAARLVVDPFRTVAALNFESFTGPGGRTEPVVSQWLPSTPLFDLGLENLPAFQNGDMTKIKELFNDKGFQLSDQSTLETIKPGGYFVVWDGPRFYPVIVTLDRQQKEVISVYGF